MTDRPILFSAPMIRALLDGRKTQTRRVLKPQPDIVPVPSELQEDHELRGWECIPVGYDYAVVKNLKHRPGDRLWVRESHYLTDDGESEYAVYAADEGDVEEHLANMQATMASHQSIDWSKHLRLRPSIHMPRWASRLTLTVTDVRVQRLQDISEVDAIEEGCRPFFDYDHPMQVPCPNGSTMEMAPHKGPLDAFHNLWNSINGPDAWDANPWVTATSFTVHKCNIDQMEKSV